MEKLVKKEIAYAILNTKTGKINQQVKSDNIHNDGISLIFSKKKNAQEFLDNIKCCDYLKGKIVKIEIIYNK